MSLLLSIDVGSSTIKLAEGTYNKKSLTINKCLEIPTPEYAIEKGHIKNSYGLADAISQALIKEKFQARVGVVTINAESAVARDIELPKAKPRELESMVRNEMKQNYHIDETDVVQYKKIEATGGEEKGGLIKYQCVVLDAALVDEYYQIVKTLGLKSLIMDINRNGIGKLLNLSKEVNNQPIQEKVCLFIDFGAESTNVYIQSMGTQEIVRHLEIGSGEIEKLISEKSLVAASEIKAKKEEGYNFFQTEAGDNDYSSILKNYFDNLSEELRNIVRFHNNRTTDSGITQAFIFGGGSRLMGLPEYLESSLNIPVERIEMLSNIVGEISKDEALTHLNSFGALIRY